MSTIWYITDLEILSLSLKGESILQFSPYCWQALSWKYLHSTTNLFSHSFTHSLTHFIKPVFSPWWCMVKQKWKISCLLCHKYTCYPLFNNLLNFHIPEESSPLLSFCMPSLQHHPQTLLAYTCLCNFSFTRLNCYQTLRMLIFPSSSSIIASKELCILDHWSPNHFCLNTLYIVDVKWTREWIFAF